MRALGRSLIAAVWALVFLFLGGWFIELGTGRHGNCEYYGTYVVLSWFIGMVGVIAILAVRRRPRGKGHESKAVSDDSTNRGNPSTDA